MKPFDEAFDLIIKTEGGYVNDALDRGGATNMGITESVAREAGYTGDMKTIPVDVVKAIYKKNYWDVLKLDRVAALAPDIAEELFDSAVNCGPNTVGRWFQESINILNKSADIKVDGKVGPGTLQALSGLKSSDHRHLWSLLKLFQGNHYVKIVQRDPSQEKFIRGWLTRV